MRTAFVLLSVVASALAQALTVNTPTGAINCLNQAISWVGGTGPYTIQIQPGGDPTQAALETFTGLAASPYSWFVIEPANTQVFIRLRDNAGTTVESGTFTVRAGGTCTSSTSAAGSSSGVVAPPADTSSVASPPAAGTTSTPAAGTTPAPSSGGSGSSSATTTRATTSTPNGAGASAKVAGGLVAVVGGVVALLA